MNTKNKPRIGIITFPDSGLNKITLPQLIELLTPNSNQIHVITGNDAYNDLKSKYDNIKFYGLYHQSSGKMLSKICRYFLAHLKYSFYLLKASKNVDVWYFMRAETLVIPITISFLLRKKTVLILGGSEKEYEMNPYLNKIESFILILFKRIGFLLSSKIVLYSPILIEKWNLTNYHDKIFIAHRHFLRINSNSLIDLSKRKKIIGFIGRLSKEKGIMNFVKAMPEILKICDVKLLVVGDGPLFNEIKNYIKSHNLENKVILTGWVSHDEIYNYIEKMKLLVLPSYTEGLPNIILESMACGTPVLATPVGAVPDIIKDKKTGFIIENNSPDCIRKGVIESLNYNNLEKIVENAFNLVNNEFSYESTLILWKQLSGEIDG